jgi:predicted nucleic acid-binding protein
MASKVFFDANVILDLTLKRDGYAHAKEILEAAIIGQINIYTSSSIIHIAGYWLTKVYGASLAKELLLALLQDVQILETDHETTLQALNSKIIDIEDAIQYHTALYHHADAFVSRDKMFLKISGANLPVYTPEEFIKTLF